MNKIKYICTVIILVSISFSLFSSASYAAPDLTTKYRVYQSNNLLKEFADDNKAIAFAKQFANSYVEEIGSRKWIWHSFPKFQVYQFNILIGTYPTIERAMAEAKKYDHTSIKNIESPGWVWDNYPTYQLYQGHQSLPNWTFEDLDAAKREAKKWANAHVIDLRTNKWVWDNIPAEKKKELRNQPKKYQVYQLSYTKDDWSFSSLEDAIKEAFKWEHSFVVDTSNGFNKVFSNEKKYKVYQYNTLLKSFVDIHDAIQYAKRWDHSKITNVTDRVIWDNYPFYQVHMENTKPVEFQTLLGALDYAQEQPKSQIKTILNQLIWDNSTRLMYWAWNGSATDATVKARISETAGLDANSPTWFKLHDSEGNIEDTSSPALVKWLQDRDIEVHPLVHNQFSSSLTSKFLSNDKAQTKFINTLVNRSAELGVDGINVDFESLSASDRNKYTLFIKNLTHAAHQRGLIVSIDLPRGSLAWNHKTAFDHVELAKIVDYIVTMTYDHHYSGSPIPGSVAGMQWTEQGVVEFLSYGIPRDKLIMGIPFYIREWKLDSTGKLISNRAITSKTATQLIADKKATSTWDPIFMQYRVEYKENGYTYVFWLEDENSVIARLNIAKKYRLAGVSAWRLGQESPNFWKAMLLEK